MTNTDAEVAARYGVSVDEEAEGIAEPWNTDGGNIRWIAKLSEGTGKAAAWLTLPLLFVLAAEAIRRFIFGNSFIWASDTAYMLYSSHFLLGAAFTLKRSGHIRTDFQYRKWAPRKQAWTDFVIYVFMFIPALILGFWKSLEFATKSMRQRETTITSPWDGPLWVLKVILPLAIFLWLLQSISEAVKSYRVIRSGQWEPPMDEVSSAAGDGSTESDDGVHAALDGEVNGG